MISGVIFMAGDVGQGLNTRPERWYFPDLQRSVQLSQYFVWVVLDAHGEIVSGLRRGWIILCTWGVGGIGGTDAMTKFALVPEWKLFTKKICQLNDSRDLRDSRP